MKKEIKVPSFGESITSARVSALLKTNGDYVEKDEEILELESDKVNSAVLAPDSGELSLSIREGDEVSIAQVIGFVDTEKQGKVSTKAAPSAPRESATPKAQEGSARVQEEGFLDSLNQKKVTAPTKAPSEVKSTLPSAYLDVPSTRRKMSSLRKTIAARLVQAKNETAMLTTFNEVDMSYVMEARTKLQDGFVSKHGVKLGFMSFFVKACCFALEKFPQINAYIDGDDLVLAQDANISIAVSTDKGLFVPVLKKSQTLDFAQIEKAILDYSQKAKTSKLQIADLQGGTFTITNGGVFGSLLSTPILNPPQSAILGMHTIQSRPVVRDEKIVIRPMMYLALSYDHRVVDGKEAVQFLIAVKEYLEDSSKWGL